MMHNFRQDMPAYIYWGSSEDIRESNRTELPSYITSDATVSDFNEDGIPDVAISNEGYEWGFDQRFGSMTNNLQSCIYWGHSTPGFEVSRRAEIAMISPADVATGDFNGDDHADLALVNKLREEQSVYVYWGEGSGSVTVESRQVLKMFADLDSPENDETRAMNTAYAEALKAECVWEDVPTIDFAPPAFVEP